MIVKRERQGEKERVLGGEEEVEHTNRKLIVLFHQEFLREASMLAYVHKELILHLVLVFFPSPLSSLLLSALFFPFYLLFYCQLRADFANFFVSSPFYCYCSKLSRHPHLVQFLGIFTDTKSRSRDTAQNSNDHTNTNSNNSNELEGDRYIVTEFLSKGSLDVLVRVERQSLTAADLIEMYVHICVCVAVAVAPVLPEQ